jgi:uroporphyrinogen decarboxylase
VLHNDLFLKACRREPVERVPIWLMRQAGRYMPVYRALRKQHSILEMIKNPDLACEVTLQPIEAFDLDAAIIFADILPLLEPLGFDLTFESGRGPVIGNPVRSVVDLDRLAPSGEGCALPFTVEAVRRTRSALAGRVPLIGFSGAPFTLFCYAIEGGGSSDFLSARRFLHAEPAAAQRLLRLLTEAAAVYLRAQIEAGADAVQLFDSWAGALGPQTYADQVLPHVRNLAASLADLDVPVIYFSTGTSAYLSLLKTTGARVISVDWRTSLREARSALGADLAVQGNLDPSILLATPEAVRAGARRVLEEAGPQPGFIFNLGHGIHKETPEDNVRVLVEAVRSSRPEGAPAT